jgi:hypothetical protein
VARKHRFGADCKVLIRSAGSWGTPTWSELKTIGECQLVPSFDKADLALRLTRVKLAVKTLAGISVTGKVLVDDSTLFETLNDAALGDGEIDVLVLNGPISKAKSRGFRFMAQVFKWDEGQNPGDVLYRDFEIAPCLPEDQTQLPQSAYIAVANTVTLTAFAPTE